MALKAGRVGVNPNYVDKEGRPLYDNTYLKELLRKEGIITLFTKEGNPISIDNAVAGRVYDLAVTMSPKQAGTGTPSPTNVREISGYTGLTITVNGTDIERDFATTVYGGVDDVTGEGVVSTRSIATIEDFSSSWLGTSLGGLYWGTIALENIDKTKSAISSMLPYKTTGAAWNSSTPCFTINDDGIRVYATETTLEDFKTNYANLVFCYTLAIPTSIPLYAQKVNLDTGSNTVSSDTGTTIDLKYLGTLVPGGVNGRSLNRSLNLNREVIDGEERKEIQEEIKEEVKEVPVEEPVTVKKSTKKSTK